MKRLIILATVTLFVAVAVSAAQSDTTIVRNGNTFTKTVTVKESKTTSQLTSYTYEISGEKYPIYITSNGRCYVVRTSKKGNEYKQYLPENIARTICSEMGIEYKENVYK